jgi:hypothetical protein
MIAMHVANAENVDASSNAAHGFTLGCHHDWSDGMYALANAKFRSGS